MLCRCGACHGAMRASYGRALTEIPVWTNDLRSAAITSQNWGHRTPPISTVSSYERRTRVLRQLGSRANGFGALLLSGGLCGLEGGKGFDGNAGELGVLLCGELFEVLDRLGKF